MSFFADKIVVTRTAKKSINLFLVFEKTGRPFPILSVSEIKVAFPKSTGVLTKTKTSGDVSIVGAPELGQLLVNLSTADTTLLKLCPQTIEGLTFTVRIEYMSGDPDIFNFKNLLFVEDPAVVAT